jgi:hypothetical protein
VKVVFLDDLVVADDRARRVGADQGDLGRLVVVQLVAVDLDDVLAAEELRRQVHPDRDPLALRQVQDPQRPQRGAGAQVVQHRPLLQLGDLLGRLHPSTLSAAPSSSASSALRTATP